MAADLQQLLGSPLEAEFRSFVTSSLASENLDVRTVELHRHHKKKVQSTRPNPNSVQGRPPGEVIPRPCLHVFRRPSNRSLAPSTPPQLAYHAFSLTTNLFLPLPQFYEAVKSYQNVESESERQGLAQSLFDTFVKGGSDQEINIDYETRKAIRTKLATGSRNLFDAALEEVTSLLTMDLIPKFKTQYALTTSARRPFQRVWALAKPI